MEQHILDNAIILASGYGKRMKRAEGSPSKPMTLINHKPLISYSIDLMIWSGIQKIYIVYQSATSDVLRLLDYSSDYSHYLEFVEEPAPKGSLLTFSRIKDHVSLPFLMSFGDVIASKYDFIDMLNIGKQYHSNQADLVVQTVCSPSLLSERAFLTETRRVSRYQKNGILDVINPYQERKYGGMIYLWLSDPFPLIDEYLKEQKYRLSVFLEQYIPSHRVFEMPIHDMWDVDTPEAVTLTKEILRKRGDWDVRP